MLLRTLVAVPAVILTVTQHGARIFSCTERCRQDATAKGR
jgi:hypothetical protein